MWTRQIRGYGGLLLVVLVGAVVLLGPVAAHLSSEVNGYRSDPASEVWLLNEFKTHRIGIVSPSRTATINTPDGAVLRRPVEITSSFIAVVSWPLIHLFSAVTTRNLLVFMGLVANGLAAVVAARALRIGRVGAGAAAVVFMFAPSVVIETRLHEALVFAFPLPLALAAGVSLIDRPRPRGAFALGGIVGLSCYVNPYLPLYTASVALAVSIVLVATACWRGLMSVAQAALAALVVAAPAILLLTFRRSDTLREVNRSLSELDIYANSPLDIIRAFGPAAAGLLVLGVAALGIGRLRSRPVSAVLGLCAMAGVVLSAGPYAHVLGHRVPMPNRALWAIYPVWRAVGRATVLVWLAAAIGIGAAVHDLWARARPGWPKAPPLAAVLILTCAVPVGAALRHGWPRFPADETVALSHLLAQRPGVIAEYPLFGQEDDAIGPYLLRQVFHGRPLFNGAHVGTTNALLSSVAGNPSDPQAAAALQLGGVTTVVMHGDEAPPVGAVPIGNVDGARVYALTPLDHPAVAVWDGAFNEEESGGQKWRWLPPSAVLRVVASEPGSYLVRATIETAPGVHRVDLGEGAVSVSGNRTVEVCVIADTLDHDGLATGSTEVGPRGAAARLAPRDPRLALARAFSTTVVGRCN